FQNEVKRSPQDFSAIYYLAEALQNDGDLVGALESAQMALKLDAQSGEAAGLLGKILFKQGKTAEALTHLKTAVAKLPNDHERRYFLARAYQQLGQREQAAREFAALQKLKDEQLKKDQDRMPKP